MTTPSITQGQFAIDPSTGSLYYKNAVGTLVQSSLSWQHVSNTAISTDDSITVAGSMVIAGNLTVNGTTVTLNTETTVIEDNIVLLNSGVTASPTLNAGIEVERGTSDNVSIIWDEGTDRWTFTNDGTTYHNFLLTTANITGTSAAWDTARTITLSGDLSGSVSLDGTSNVTLSATLQAAAVANKANIASPTFTGTVTIPAGAVISGYATLANPTFTGTVAGVTKAMVGLGDVDNTTDASKPVSTAQQTALDLKANIANPTFTGVVTIPAGASISGYATLANPTFTGTVAGVTKSMVGLGDVDNTADTAKPVSTAQQTALDLKSNIASPTFTGTVTIPAGASISGFATLASPALTGVPTAPTAAANTNTTQIATTAFVQSELTELLGEASAAFDTLKEIEDALTSGGSTVINLITEVDTKASKSNPTFTGTVTIPTLLVDGIEVDTTGAIVGQVLKYDGNKFIPSQDNVAAAGSLNLSDLSNVLITSVQDGSVLSYSSASSKWVNAPLGLDLDGLSDVSVTSVANKEVIIYDAGSSLFRNARIGISDIVSFNITSLANNDHLRWDSASDKWVNVPLDGMMTFNQLSDVTTTSVASDQFIKWNGTAWVNSTVSPVITLGGDLTGSVTLTDLASATLTATIAANSVSLGTDTTGDYVATITGGTGVTSTASTTGEGTTHTLSIGQEVGTNANVSFNNISAAGDILLGANAATFAATLTNPTLVVQGDYDDYAQIAFRNIGTSTNSSTDIIAYCDTGTDESGWIDMGVTSANFSDPDFTITGAHDGYIFYEAKANTTGSGNLVFATGANGTHNHIVFAAGGLSSDNTQMTIFPDVNVHIEIPTPSISASTGALTVVGGVGIQGNLNIAGNVSIQGTITFGGGGTTVETENLSVSDPFIFLANTNTSDILDSGFVTGFKNSDATPSTRYAGIVRDASDGVFKFFTSATTKPTSTVNFSEAGLAYASVRAHDVTAESITSNSGITLAAGNAVTIGSTQVLTASSYVGQAASVVNGIYTTDTATVTPTMLATGPARAGFRSEINAQTGTSYTLVLGDLAKLITMDNSSPMTLTVPENASVAFEVGDKIDILRKGTGTLAIEGTGSASVNATPGLNLRAQWSSATLVKLATNTWVLIGDLAA
jgi:hypothetical protein